MKKKTQSLKKIVLVLEQSGILHNIMLAAHIWMYYL